MLFNVARIFAQRLPRLIVFYTLQKNLKYFEGKCQRSMGRERRIDIHRSVDLIRNTPRLELNRYC